jgi:predicted O-methyltransferase YrrM
MQPVAANRLSAQCSPFLLSCSVACLEASTLGLSRLLQYAKAYTELRELDHRCASLLDRPRALIEETFRFADSFLGPVQVIDEFAPLLDEVHSLRPQTVLEIGTHRGGTLYLWTRVASPSATLISIDLPKGRFGGGYSRFRIPLYRRFARERQKLHLLRADSHAPATFRKTQRILARQPLDFLFIDGDHTFRGVQLDWEMYSSLVRKGGLIAFHDIAGDYSDTQVKSFWDTLKTHFSHHEYVADSGGKYGLGVLRK